MKKRKKKPILAALLLLGGVLLLAGIFVAAAFLSHPQGKPIYADGDDVVELEIGDGDFVILNLTDIQLADLEDIGHFAAIHAEIDELVARAEPDLITVTGDLVWSNENNISLHALIRWLEGYGIPWAPVLGNHDLGNEKGSATASGDYLVRLLESAEHCLFRHGERELGVGHYAVKIMQNGSLLRVLYMMDTGYTDEISEAQKAWFEKTTLALREEYGEVPGMVFTHKPLSEYRAAYYAYRLGDAVPLTDVVVACSLEGVESNGLFSLLQQYGVTDVVCGHQHANAFTIPYGGIRLTFGVKTGELVFYWDDGETNLNGGTVFRVSGSETEVSWLTVDRERFSIAGSDNIAAE